MFHFKKHKKRHQGKGMRDHVFLAENCEQKNASLFILERHLLNGFNI